MLSAHNRSLKYYCDQLGWLDEVQRVNWHSWSEVTKAGNTLSSRHVSSCDVKSGDTLSSRHVSSCDVNACSWDVRGELTLNSMAHIHTSVTLLTSRDLAWSSGRLKCQHASQISAVVHISWDVTYVSSSLQTLPVVSRNGGNAYWKSEPKDLFIRHQVTRL